MNIETKIGIGDQVFVLKKITKTTCPICNGTGKIRLGKAATFNADTMEQAMQQVAEQIIECIENNTMREYACPECKGSGSVKATGQKKYEILTCKVVSMQFTIGGENIPPVIMYSVVDEKGTVRKMMENQFYTNRADADKQCFIFNLERREIPIADIRVPYSFASTIPCNEKLNKRLDEWRKNKKFETEIYVDDCGNLFDGYTSYLVYKMMGIDTVPVVVWPTVKKNKEEKTDAVSV
jgi:hypothetical protein|nr:MAG TPA: antitermination protein [Caudoviricetes sp.]